MSSKRQGRRLAPGSAVRVRRVTGDLVGQYTVPSGGTPLVIRDLPPGRYVAVDDAGEPVRAFVVSGREELVALPAPAPERWLELPGEPVIGEAAAATVDAVFPVQLPR